MSNKEPIANMPEFKEPQNLEVRYTVPNDIVYLTEWFLTPGTIRWFPMQEPGEIEDSMARWINFYRWKCSLTAVLNGEPAGIATLWLQPYKKIAHQCQFGIIVNQHYRKMGIGSVLVKNIMNLAKNYFKIELIHLEVYYENPAYHLYKKFGFEEFGRQDHWIKDKGEYVGRIFMQRSI